MKKSSMVWGVILIVAGLFLLVDNLADLRILSMERIWPVFILITGLAFEFAYFSKKQNPGFLVPGGIITVIGLLFFFETFTNWRFAAYTWPVYPLAVAIGLFQLYLFTQRERGLLVPIFILTAVSVVSFAAMFLNTIQKWVDLGIVLPILLVVFGVIILLRNILKKSE
ncbi:DUF5668 domain-containing protein [Dehalobacter sp. DCM]|uniref:LiaI-LiaF-like domain-containing protein n=1 Tax=Dehalobacter sp. DCM TaxID=2907827 RepID=UPI0030815ADB|nr:DUF5668 domain-containing protein [Dehalobacter sp. DCM]